MSFNKKVLLPRIQKDETQKLRQLESEAIKIEKFVKITVKDSDIDEDVDKSILSYSMVSSSD